MPPETCIITLEKATKQHDTKMAETIGNPIHFAEYRERGYPYQRDYSLSPSMTWLLWMNPLMSEVLAAADFVEMDVTYKAAVEMEYLLNVVAFNYTTMQCKKAFSTTCVVHALLNDCKLLFASPLSLGHVVARVHLNRVNKESYANAFRAIFRTVKQDHP